MLSKTTLSELLARPVIAVVRRTEELDGALRSPSNIIELRASSLMEPLDAKISFRDKSLYWSHGKCDTLKNSITTLFPAF